MLTAIRNLRNGCANRADLTALSDRNFVKFEPPSDLAEKIIRRQGIPFRRGWTQIIRKRSTPFRQLDANVAAGSRDRYLGSITAVWLNLSQRGRHSLMQGQEIGRQGRSVRYDLLHRPTI